MFAASSLLFVPGSRPDRFAKAAAAGAGLVVIDLEDAVGPADKESARAAALQQVAEAGEGFAIRINAVTTAAGIRDLAALTEADVLPAILMVPMVETATELDIVASALGDRCPQLIPLIETPRGLRSALAIVSHPQVCALMFGGADFSGELRVAVSWEPLLAARQQLVLACAEARKPLIDVPFIHLDDDAGLERECEAARAIGISAKAAIHPRQVPAIEAAFSPTEAEIAEAEEALRVYEETGGKAVRHKGRMLEAPMIKTYRAVIARSKGQANA
ncbi:CoA ester lyase [Altererythrobacter sp. BO-6]|uniref:HpcH/HpaI aldolase/citrate lyase family protein n=1 Tax=Altererythrobacter sp. BO-6 TaxID=2604537 RepID=UPI0013E1688B|nr:CoA ester lyase [Altererythrobacter sp. BO-6]QIG53551.1 CoA ester lyase [Altererythrobacter sp. BO-6]